MADREKVIKGLKAHADGCGYRSHHCDAMECPYRYGDESCDIEEMCRDAIELLKEQEAVKPIRQIEQTEWTVCGNCRKHIISKWTFCPYCGQAVKWE